MLVTPDKWPDNFAALVPNFTVAEVRCKCGECGLVPDLPDMISLQELRREVGFPLIVNSGARCRPYDDRLNARVASTELGGPHTIAAFDLGIYGERAHALIKAAMRHGVTGLGVQQHGPLEHRFIHIDWLDRIGRPSVWGYS